MGGYDRKNMFGLKINYKELLKLLVSRLLEDRSHHVLLVPHAFSSVEADLPACKNLWRRVSKCCGSRVHLISRSYDQSELKWLIGTCDFFIGSRLHSCIGALSQRVPTIGLAYSRKFSGVFESVGVGGMAVDMTGCDTETIVRRCLQSFENRDLVSSVLASKLPEVETHLRKVFERLLEEKALPRTSAVGSTN